LLSPLEQLAPIFIVFLPFSILNIYASYHSNLYVTTPTLNIPRAEMIIHTILHDVVASERLPYVREFSMDNKVLTPEEISQRESFVGRYISPFDIPLAVEPSLHNYSSPMYAAKLGDALTHANFIHKEKYFILPCIGNLTTTRRKYNAHVALWFTDNANTRDLIKGFYHACVLRHLWWKSEIMQKMNDEQYCYLINYTHGWVNVTFDNFLGELNRKGWDTECIFFVEKDDNRLIIET
jgi:hypothetical protein